MAMVDQTKWANGAFNAVGTLAKGITYASIIVGAVVIVGKPWADDKMDDYLKPLTAAIQQNSVRIDEMNQARREESAARASVRETLSSISEVQSNISKAQDQMTRNINDAITRLSVLENDRKADASPVMRFLQDPQQHNIGAGTPGSTVEMTWRFVKLRGDCGRPLVELYFRNGGGRIHRFRNASILDQYGRGIGFPKDTSVSQEVTYTAQIPKDENVRPGYAAGWNRISYPDCPAVGPERSPDVPFEILKPVDTEGD